MVVVANQEEFGTGNRCGLDLRGMSIYGDCVWNHKAITLVLVL